MSAVVASDTIKPGSRRTNLAPEALTWCLALFLLLNGFALNGVLMRVLPAEHSATVLEHTQHVLYAEGCDDSWWHMANALEYAQSPHTTPLYTEIFFNRGTKWQYPPTSLFILMGMLWLAGPDLVRTDLCPDYEFASFNDVLGWLFILMSAAAAAILLERGLRQHLLVPSPGILLAARAAIVGGLALTFYPIVKAFTVGQTQVLLNGTFAIALLCWATGRKGSSGTLIALMCLVKPHYGLFVLWAALRREWRFTAACVATGAIGLLASIAVFGWADNVDYLKVLWFMSQHGETFYPNQSINGLLNRVMTLIDPDSYDSLEFQETFAPFNPWIYAATLTTAVVILSAALFRRGNDGDPDRTFDFCTMALSVTIASPIAWEHHYGILFPVFAVLLAGSIGNRTRLMLIAASYILISNFFPATNLLASTILNVAQSYLFFAALVVLMLLHTARPGWQIGGLPFARPRSAPLSLKPQ